MSLTYYKGGQSVLFTNSRKQAVFFSPGWRGGIMAFVESEWEEFHSQDMSDKAQYFRDDKGVMTSCIFPHQFKRADLDRIFKLADAIREIQDTREGALFLKSLLPHKRAMLLFKQASTRTFTSFWAACSLLGIDTCDVRDMKTSSEGKGEHRLDTLRTISEIFDVVVMRAPEKDLAEKSAWHLSRTRRPIPVINAGSGLDLHTTQGLLDTYTFQRQFRESGGLDNKTLILTGDLRGRTVRTICYLAREYKNVTILLCAPEEFQMKQDILEFMDKHGINYEVHYDLEPHMSRADIIYLTRIQDEYDVPESVESELENAVEEILGDLGIPVEGEFSFDRARLLQLISRLGALYAAKDNVDSQAKPSAYNRAFSFLPEHLNSIKDSTIICHPLPRRGELHFKCDEDDRVKIWSQVRNGMWIRAALLSIIFGVDREIMKNLPRFEKEEEEVAVAA